MSIIMLTNLKGGVAKTTNAIAVAECFASQGKRTLVIDADHQCTASEALLGEDRFLARERQKKTLHDLFSRMLEPTFSGDQFSQYVVKGVSNIGGTLGELALLPCSFRMDDFQSNYAKGGHGFKTWPEFRRMFDRHRALLRKWLQHNFEFVIVDCPPSLGLQVKLLLGISDTYIVPCQPNRLSLRGAYWLRERIRRAGYTRDCLGTLWSMYRQQDAFQHAVIMGTTVGLPEIFHPFRTVIPMAAHIGQAMDLQGTPRTFHAKYRNYAAIYSNLCEEIIDRCELAGYGGTSSQTAHVMA